MQEAHKDIPISDQLFDAFISLCVQSLKEMRVKHDCLKETTRTLQSLRDHLVKKPEDLMQPATTTTLFQEMGGMEKFKEIARRTMEGVGSHQDIGRGFKFADRVLHEKRLALYLAHLAGNNQEWLGKNMKEAHKGKCISNE